MKSAVILSQFIGLAFAAKFGAYLDSACTIPITSSVIFTDVCTWSSNRFSGSWSLYVNECSTTELSVYAFNASDAPTCVGTPLYTLPVNSTCTPFMDSYIRGLDFTCESQGTTYNILAHVQSDCTDGGIPFSVQLGEPSCQSGAFAPGFFSWDVEGNYSQPYYNMNIYSTTNGTCEDVQASVQTTSFPAHCLPLTPSLQVVALDIYTAFPMVE